MKNLVILATPSPTSHRTAEENLGIGYLASVLRASQVDVRVIDAWLLGLSEDELANVILQAQEEVCWIGFSSYLSNAQELFGVVQRLKTYAPNIPLVVGGYGPTFEPLRYVENGLDLAVIGEAEERILNIHRWARGELAIDTIPGICYRNPDAGVVHTTPAKQPLLPEQTPARDTISLLRQRKSPPHIETSRGCMAHCTFCSIIAFSAQHARPIKWRERSITRVVDDIAMLFDMGFEMIKVVDDSFIEPPRDEAWCASLADALEKRNIKVRLRGQIRADRVSKPILTELRRAGFFSFACGIENFSDSALKRMAKTSSAAVNHEAMSLFQELGFIVQAGHIMFDPYTTLSELRENLEALRLYPNAVGKGIFSEMYAAVGTPFTRTLKKRGLIASESSISGNSGYKVMDPKASEVYRILKLWHTRHMSIYDKTVDVLNAPKAVSDELLHVFHTNSSQLRDLDLKFFEQVLDAVECGTNPTDLDELFYDCCENSSDEHHEIQLAVDQLYQQAELPYDVQLNPFL